MGLFNYSKPGPGISKDAPKKKGIFLYIELFGRKFSKLISINLLYLLCSLPALILYFVIFALTLPNMFGYIMQYSAMENQDFAVMQLMFSLVLSLLCAATLGTGPASASLAYIFKQYSQEEHIWLTSTFFEKIKENFKRELIIWAIDSLFVFVATFALGFYYNKYLMTGSSMWFFFVVLLSVFSAIFVFMHYYIHQLLVSYENTLREIYRNSLLFVLSHIIPCVLLSVFILGTVFCIFNYLFMLNAVIPIAVTIIILFSFLRFPVEFYVQSSIKKTLKTVDGKNNNSKEDAEEAVFSDSHGSEK